MSCNYCTNKYEITVIKLNNGNLIGHGCFNRLVLGYNIKNEVNENV